MHYLEIREKSISKMENPFTKWIFHFVNCTFPFRMDFNEIHNLAQMDNFNVRMLHFFDKVPDVMFLTQRSVM